MREVMQQLRSVLLGLWHGLDVLRKSLHLLLLLMIFAFLVGALRGSSPVIPGRAALLIAPEGEIVEQLSGDPLQRALEEARGDRHNETLLWDLTQSIRAAANDRRIPVIAIDVDRLDSAGQPMLGSLVGSPGFPTMTIKRQRSGCRWICVMSSSNK